MITDKPIYSQEDYFGINSRCDDTILYTPSVNAVIHTKCESKIDGFYLNNKKVDKSYYVYFTQLRDSIIWFRWKKESLGCYIIFFDKDSSKVEEGHFKGECFKGPYKSYYKNGNLKEEGTFSIRKYCAKIGKWKCFNEKNILIREEFYKENNSQNEDEIKDIDSKYYFRTGTWSYWDDKGNLVKQEKYEENVLVETKKF